MRLKSIKNLIYIYGAAALAVLLAFNIYLIISINSVLFPDTTVYLSGNAAADARSLIFSRGVPEIYGEELGVAYEFDLRNHAMMNYMIMKMSNFDRGPKKIDVDSLPADLKKRYIGITTKISCEFCCGARAITFPNGEPACGCAHSSAMRGLALYLLQNHPDKFSDERILQELSRWKALFFPKQMMLKYAKQALSDSYTPDIAALMLGAKKGGGELIKQSDLNIEALPDMAGAC